MQGDLTPAIALSIFGNPGGLQLPTFGSVGFTLTLSPKWGCDTLNSNAIKIVALNKIMYQVENSIGDSPTEEENRIEYNKS
jgi:hypothetical protein